MRYVNECPTITGVVIMIDARRDLAERIAAGLAGWLQFRAAQNLQDIPGEDSFRLACAEIIHAQGKYQLRISPKPIGWPESDGKRIDMALLPPSVGSSTWYGGLELKWPSASGNFQGSRRLIVQDVVRLAMVRTANLKAQFLVLGGTQGVIDGLFKNPHQKESLKGEVSAFCNLLRCDPKAPPVSMTLRELRNVFGRACDGLPTGMEPRNGVQVQLLASSAARLRPAVNGSDEGASGHIYVWQCNQRRGRAAVAETAVSSL